MMTKLKTRSLPEMEVLMVSPSLALQWLENTNFHNRRLEDRNVDKIARDITSQKWIYDGNPIRFDVDGNVIDGQHRLWAIVKSDKSVRSLVVRSLQHSAVDVIDTGKSRGIADVLHFNGFVNNNVLGGACRIIIGYKAENGDLLKWATRKSRVYISPSEIVSLAKTDKNVVSAVETTQSLKMVKKLVGLSTAAFCYYIFSAINKTDAVEFFNLLERGTDLPEGSPILILRNVFVVRDVALRNQSARGGNRSSAYKIALIIKAWNAFRQGESIRRLRFGEEVEFYPKPI